MDTWCILILILCRTFQLLTPKINVSNNHFTCKKNRSGPNGLSIYTALNSLSIMLHIGKFNYRSPQKYINDIDQKFLDVAYCQVRPLYGFFSSIFYWFHLLKLSADNIVNIIQLVVRHASTWSARRYVTESFNVLFSLWLNIVTHAPTHRKIRAFQYVSTLH